MPKRLGVPIPLIGPSSKARSPAQQSGRTVNLYPEVNGDGDAKAVVALLNCPGFFRVRDLTTEITDGELQIRGMHRMGDRWFLVAGELVCELTYDATLNFWNNLTVLTSLSTFSGRVGMSDNNGILIIGDGTGFFTLDLTVLPYALVPVLNQSTDIIRGTFSRWIDGYTLYFERDTSKYYYSDLNDPTTVGGLNFMSAEGDPDATVAALVSNREVIILGTRSTEYHHDTGDTLNAFERIEGGFAEYGCVARWSACNFAGGVAMVGRNNEGQGAVWLFGSAGAAPRRISTHAVEKAIEKVLFSTLERTDLTEQITAFAYEQEGHSFYVLNLPACAATNNSPLQPSMTWVYDATTGLWHERGFLNPETGLFERILGDIHITWRNRHYLGAYDHAHIYEMSLDYYRDNTELLVKMRETAGPISFNGRRWTLDKLEIQGEHGVGRDGGVQGSDPTLAVQFCWDGRWSNEIYRPWGKIGERNVRSIFTACGSGYELVIRVTMADPVKTVFTGALADVTIGR